MTPEEAIECIKSNYPPENYTMFREALEIAVVALSCAGQIYRLEEKLVEERARSKYYFDVAGSWGIDLLDTIDEPGKKSRYETDAREQLRVEMPEVFE